ncbi:hypothetical protein FHW16_002870 [Phyllobacterium myrsinacearum]|uniref:Uncharacterized protein n=1 Tax=Phyllobacterium myrsinacearum TaxID=28101 RepID=A0A839EJW2_9HYPH|nr:hypothetical protein [Phyllobacterium myrsinacearum]
MEIGIAKWDRPRSGRSPRIETHSGRSAPGPISVIQVLELNCCFRRAHFESLAMKGYEPKSF